MDDFDLDLVTKIPNISRNEVLKLLHKESEQLPLTTSLLNLLHNIVIVGSVAVSESQKEYFDSHADLVLKLLNPKIDIFWKKRQLEKDISLVLNIATSCPTVAGS